MTEAIIPLSPLVGYSTHTIPGNAIVLTVDYVNSEQELQTGVKHTLRLAILAPLVRELGEALLRASEAAAMGQAPSTSRN